ncbi:uncharacterized protein LOC127778451 isoform X1 [Oryza glaberrima]|uniref:uncharacterized protein LOC127778451 isoform X1 n=1 Tax=Oryza glaberrima TaxID=4538 RepID=UPI00224C1020|nr:uncharacterized protein LOC127778451 isoform X1 [Oryza glaberrima]
MLSSSPPAGGALELGVGSSGRAACGCAYLRGRDGGRGGNLDSSDGRQRVSTKLFVGNGDGASTLPVSLGEPNRTNLLDLGMGSCKGSTSEQLEGHTAPHDLQFFIPVMAVVCVLIVVASVLLKGLLHHLGQSKRSIGAMADNATKRHAGFVR